MLHEVGSIIMRALYLKILASPQTTQLVLDSLRHLECTYIQLQAGTSVWWCTSITSPTLTLLPDTQFVNPASLTG